VQRLATSQERSRCEDRRLGEAQALSMKTKSDRAGIRRRSEKVATGSGHRPMVKGVR